jgi:hypothetical protein
MASRVSCRVFEERMSKSRHTEAQLIGALKQLEEAQKAEDVVREACPHTIYR